MLYNQADRFIADRADSVLVHTCQRVVVDVASFSRYSVWHGLKVNTYRESDEVLVHQGTGRNPTRSRDRLSLPSLLVQSIEPMCQVPTTRQIQPHDSIVWVQQPSIHAEVCWTYTMHERQSQRWQWLLSEKCILPEYGCTLTPQASGDKPYASKALFWHKLSILSITSFPP